MRKIVLASASPRRRELLEKAGVSFVVRPGNGEEIITKTLPREVVEELSYTKAVQAAELQKDAPDGTIILGADTLVSYGDEILGKPKNEADAERMLTMLSGQTHQVYTGVTWLLKENGTFVPHTFSECTDVIFYPVSQEEILRYIATGEPMDKAGSYAIQGLWGIHVRGICGDYNNVVGLPVARLFQETQSVGIDLRGESNV